MKQFATKEEFEAYVEDPIAYEQKDKTPLQVYLKKKGWKIGVMAALVAFAIFMAGPFGGTLEEQGKVRSERRMWLLSLIGIEYQTPEMKSTSPLEIQRPQFNGWQRKKVSNYVSFDD